MRISTMSPAGFGLRAALLALVYVPQFAQADIPAFVGCHRSVCHDTIYEPLSPSSPECTGFKRPGRWDGYDGCLGSL